MVKAQHKNATLEEAIASIKKWDITVLAAGLISVQLNLLHTKNLTVEDQKDLVEQWTQMINLLIKNTRHMRTLEEYHAKH